MRVRPVSRSKRILMAKTKLPVTPPSAPQPRTLPRRLIPHEEPMPTDQQDTTNE